MTSSDLDQVIEIDRVSFPTPWPEEAFEYELRHQNQNYCWVAEWIEGSCETSIVGDIVIWLHGADAHIGTLAVRPGYRRLGIGRTLLKSGLIFCLQKGIKSVSLEVRESNLAAQRLYQSMGFSEVGRKENYYEDSHEDAIVMDLLLSNEDQLADLANNG